VSTFSKHAICNQCLCVINAMIQQNTIQSLNNTGSLFSLYHLPLTQYFCSTPPFPMATQTFLNEEESAAMPGMSSLSTMLATTPGTCVQAFHTLHWICDREKRRLRNYSRIFVDLFLPVVPQTSVLNKVHFY